MTRTLSPITVFGPGGQCIQSGASAPYALRRFDHRGKAQTATCPTCGGLVGLNASGFYMRHSDKRPVPVVIVRGEDEGSLVKMLEASIAAAKARKEGTS